MKYFQVYLSTYRMCIIACSSREELDAMIKVARKDWPAIQSGVEVAVIDSIPSRAEWMSKENS